MKLIDRAKEWIGNKLAELILGAAVPEPEQKPLVDNLKSAPEDATLIGPEAESMLATGRAFEEAKAGPPPLEGSVEERRARLRSF